MPTLREQIENQRDNFRDALVAGGMPRASAQIFADELTPIVALGYITRRRKASGAATRAKKADLLNGTITRAEYDAWRNQNEVTEYASIGPDGTITIGDLNDDTTTPGGGS